VTAVKSWFRYGDLHKKVQEAVEADVLKPSAALELADLKRNEQVDALQEMVDNGGKITTSRAKTTAKAKKNGTSTDNVAQKIGKRTWLAIIDAAAINEDYAAVFEGVDPIDLAHVILGEKSPKTIKGLTALINEN